MHGGIVLTWRKFRVRMKFFLDFKVDFFLLWLHLRPSQGAITGRLVYARV